MYPIGSLRSSPISRKARRHYRRIVLHDWRISPPCPRNLLGGQSPLMDWQLAVIALVLLASLALVLVVTAETLVAVYRLPALMTA